jgi:CRISPR-associated exonuclease Cas4
MFTDDELLMISGIQHFIYSPRQWAIIHVEQQWSENFQTFAGRELHNRADDPYIKEKRGDLIISRALPVSSHRLGVYGVCDAVEWKADKDGVSIKGHRGTFIPTVVEYKRGKTKVDHSDKLQVAAYVVCLEEMLKCHLSQGVLFYFKTRHREIVAVDQPLRVELGATVARMHEYFRDGYTPPITSTDEGKKSSLDEIVPPEIFNGGLASKYIERSLRE